MAGIQTRHQQPGWRGSSGRRELRSAGGSASLVTVPAALGMVRSSQACAVGYIALNGAEHHTLRRGKTGEQELRAERANLLFGKVDHANDLPTHEVLGLVQRHDLRAGFFLAIGSEVSPHLPRWFACFR